MGCTNVSVEAVTNLVKTLPGITYVGSDKLSLLYKQLVTSFDHDQQSSLYQIENFEHTVTDSDNDEDDNNSDDDFMSKIAAHCPNIQTVKLNINQVSLIKYFFTIMSKPVKGSKI